MLVDLNDHLLDHFLHLFNLGRYLYNLMLHFSVLKNTLRAEHRAIILAIELDLLLRMDLTKSNAIGRRLSRLILAITGGILILDTHGQRRQHLVVDRQVLRRLVVTDLVVRTLNHLVLVELLGALEAEGVAARQGYGLLVVVIVGLEADAALKYLVHLL